MRAVLSSRCAAVFSFLSTSFCLRYGIAMPSVWLLWRACNLLRFNEVGFDYPLNSSWLLCRYLTVVRALFVRLQSRTVRKCAVPGSRPEWATVIAVSLECQIQEACCHPELFEPVLEVSSRHSTVTHTEVTADADYCCTAISIWLFWLHAK